MNIITPIFEILEQDYNKKDLLKGLFKHIEICGRTCYKSENKITDDSYKNFVRALEDADHGAMLEHGTVYLTIPLGTPIDDPQYMWKMDIVKFFQNNKYSKVKSKVVNKTVDVEIKGYGMRTQASAHFYFITTNWRVIFEAQDDTIIKYALKNYTFDKTTLKDSVLQWMTEPTDDHEKRYTVRFTYHLAVARDINRHRVQSIGEESTRYCNYSKEKFNDFGIGGFGETNGINIVKPTWIDDFTHKYEDGEENYYNWSFNDIVKELGDNENNWTDIDWWLFANICCETAYLKLTQKFKWTPQQASLILPLDTKTCSVHTAFASDWCHFFNLRALGTTGAPRPSAKEVAWPLMIEFIDRGWISDNQIDSEKYHEIINKYENILDYIKK